MTVDGKVKTIYPFASCRIDSDPVRMPDFARRGHEAGEKVYSDAYYFNSSHELFEVFCVAGVRPLRDSVSFANGQLDMINIRVDGIEGPICCLKVDLAGKKNSARSFVKTVEWRAVLYCGGYSPLVHEQVLLRTAMKGRFNRVLHCTGILYSLRAAPQEGKAEEGIAVPAAASRKKMKRGSGGGVGPSKSRWRKGLLPLNVDSGSSPEGGFVAPNAPRPIALKPPSVLMHDSLDEPFVPAKKTVAKRPHVVGSEVICSLFLFMLFIFQTSFSFLFLSDVVPYSAAIAAADKQTVSAALLFGTALSSLSEEALVAELQTSLRKSQDVAVVLASRALRLSELTKEFAVAKEANSQLELEIKRLKEAASSDKEALATSQRGLEAAEQKLKTTELERGSLSSMFARHDRAFATKGPRISFLLSTSLEEVGAHVPPFEVVRGADLEARFFDWLEAQLPIVPSVVEKSCKYASLFTAEAVHNFLEGSVNMLPIWPILLRFPSIATAAET